MASTTYHAQLIKYDSSGNQSILNLKNTGDDVSISRTSNGNLPSTVTSAQTLANAFGSLAFKSAVTWNDVSGLASTELTVSSEGKLADARAIKALNDKIATNASNITKLNSNLAETDGKVSSNTEKIGTLTSDLSDTKDQSAVATLVYANWTGTSAPYSYKISNSKILANSNVDVSIASSATNAQALAYVAGAFIPGAVAAGSVTIKAYGKKPKVDIPIAILIHGKEKS